MGYERPDRLDLLDGEALRRDLTALARMPVLLQAFRRLDLRRSVKRNLVLKQRASRLLNSESIPTALA